MVNARNILLLIIGIIFLLSVALNVYHFATESSSSASTSDTTRVTIYDTIKVVKPIAKDSVVVRYVAEVVRVTDTIIDSVNVGTDCTLSEDIEVEIPITQKVYEDSTYKAYVSGFRSNLDSIFVYPKTEVRTINIKPKPKRWGIGVQVGYGLSLTPAPKFAPYIGVGISYNLFNF